MASTGRPFPASGITKLVRTKTNQVMKLFVKPDAEESGFYLYFYDKKTDCGFTLLHDDGSKVLVHTTEDLNYIFWERGYWYFHTKTELKGGKKVFRKGVYPFSRRTVLKW